MPACRAFFVSQKVLIFKSLIRRLMIHKLILKNFKKVKEETFLFNNFDLIVGANNSGKSTALQALAIWQYCVDQHIAEVD